MCKSVRHWTTEKRLERLELCIRFELDRAFRAILGAIRDREDGERDAIRHRAYILRLRLDRITTQTPSFELADALA